MNCMFCSRTCKKGGFQNHVDYCQLNPNRRSRSGANNPNYGRKGSNAAIKARDAGIHFVVTEETRQRLSIAGRGHRWSEARRKAHSVTMARVAASNPKSYSIHNVVGRVRTVEVVDGYDQSTKVRGQWELRVATWLNDHGMRWTNHIEEHIMYEWEGVCRRYYPDFYLPDRNLYLEVKGYQTDRDLVKWKAVPNLLVLRKAEITNLDGVLRFLQ